jgi:hypothetical protein
MRLNVNWLDRAVGLERWPDAGWARLDTGRGLLGFDQSGNPVYLNPPGTPPGVLITSNPVITQGVMTASGHAHMWSRGGTQDDLGDHMRSRLAADLRAWAVFPVLDPKNNITWTAT